MRVLTEADVPAILALQSACYEAGYLEPAASFAAKLACSPQTSWGEFSAQPQTAGAGAEAEQPLLAYLICLPVPTWHGPLLHATRFTQVAQPHALYLHDLALHPSVRGQGVGLRLVARAEDWARSQGLRALSLMAVQGSAGYWALHGFAPLDAEAADGTVDLTGDAAERERVVASYGPGVTLMVKPLPR